MTRAELASLPPGLQEEIYRQFASSYLSLPPDRDEAHKALSILEQLQEIFRLDRATAQEWLLECIERRKLINEFIDEVLAEAA